MAVRTHKAAPEPSPSASVDAIARDIADHAAGATYDELRAEEEAIRRRLDTWLSSYRAAVATDRQQAAFAPPPLTVTEAATALSVSKDTIYTLIRSGQLRKVAGLDQVIRVPRAEIDRFLGETG